MCTANPTALTEEQCRTATVCELPDGTLEFGLSEEECHARNAQCSVRCAGESCRSYSDMAGVCGVGIGGDNTTCMDFETRTGVRAEFDNISQLCYAADVTTAAACVQVCVIFILLELNMICVFVVCGY